MTNRTQLIDDYVLAETAISEVLPGPLHFFHHVDPDQDTIGLHGYYEGRKYWLKIILPGSEVSAVEKSAYIKQIARACYEELISDC